MMFLMLAVLSYTPTSTFEIDGVTYIQGRPGCTLENAHTPSPIVFCDYRKK